MKVKISKSQWEFMGKKAGWKIAEEVNVNPIILKRYLMF